MITATTTTTTMTRTVWFPFWDTILIRTPPVLPVVVVPPRRVVVVVVPVSSWTTTTTKKHRPSQGISWTRQFHHPPPVPFVDANPHPNRRPPFYYRTTTNTTFGLHHPTRTSRIQNVDCNPPVCTVTWTSPSRRLRYDPIWPTKRVSLNAPLNHHHPRMRIKIPRRRRRHHLRSVPNRRPWHPLPWIIAGH